MEDFAASGAVAACAEDASAVRDHLRADEKLLAQSVFPGSEAVKPMAGLVAQA